MKRNQVEQKEKKLAEAILFISNKFNFAIYRPDVYKNVKMLKKNMLSIKFS